MSEKGVFRPQATMEFPIIRVDAEIRQLIRMMAQDGWGAPRIDAELTKLGFLVSEMTVSRYLPRRPIEADQVKRWVAFLRNHKDEIAAMDRQLPSRAPRARRGPQRASFHSPRPVLHQPPRGPLPLGSRQGYAEREVCHTAAIVDGQSRCTAASGWASPSLRVTRRCVRQFSSPSRVGLQSRPDQ